MIELKYIGVKEIRGIGVKDKEIEEKIKEAKEQLIKYDKGERYLKIIIVFQAYEMVYCKELIN